MLACWLAGWLAGFHFTVFLFIYIFIRSHIPETSVQTVMNLTFSSTSVSVLCSLWKQYKQTHTPSIHFVWPVPSISKVYIIWITREPLCICYMMMYEYLNNNDAKHPLCIWARVLESIDKSFCTHTNSSYIHSLWHAQTMMPFHIKYRNEERRIKTRNT